MRKASGSQLVVTVLVSSLCLCGRTGADPQAPARPAPPPKVDERLTSANLRFSFKLFCELLREQPGRNVLVSPTSIAMALAMTYNGAAGGTAQAMAKTLELGDLSLDQVNQAYLALRTGLQDPDTDVRLSIANSLWARRGTPFNPAFFEVNGKYYGATVATLDFMDPNSAAIINDWVARKTENMITGVVSPEEMMRRDMYLYLINAVYFDGHWTTPFDRDDTRGGYFALPGGGRKVMPMMSRGGEFQYLETADFQAIMLPYGQRQRLSMCVVLPAMSSSLERLCGGLTVEKWSAWLGNLTWQAGRIVLPRFTLECGASLNKALSALGMAVAFDPHRADLSRMTEGVWIDKVDHETVVRVNEEGTKAAAATAVGMAGGVGGGEKPFEMIVNRPFLCAIWDRETKTPLFLGAVVDPGIINTDQ